jgi:hypothetical protein
MNPRLESAVPVVSGYVCIPQPGPHIPTKRGVKITMLIATRVTSTAPAAAQIESMAISGTD